MQAGNGGGNGNGQKGRWIPAEWVVKLKKVEPWPEPVDGKALLEELAATVSRFVVLSKWALEAVVSWIVQVDLRRPKEVGYPP